MTLRELFSEVSALGFESDGELDMPFVFSANRALMQISTELSETRCGSLIAHGCAPELICDSFTYRGTAIAYELSGGSLSFRVCGEGECLLVRETDTRRISFSGSDTAVKAYTHGAKRIEFIGDKPYTVTDLAVFEETFGDSESSIPTWKRWSEYELCSHLDGYLCPAGVPEDSHGRAIPEGRVEGGTLYLPPSYSGRVYLKYKGVPRLTSLDSPDEKIELADALCYLLPILTSSYVWLDDDEDKAAYYMNIYVSEAARLRRTLRGGIDSTYRTVGGWA